MSKRYKNLRVGVLSGLIVGFCVLSFSLMFDGWSQTLVRKTELLENYPNRAEIARNYVSITDHKVLAERSQSILDRLDKVDSKLDAILFHSGITYKENKCLRPPCGKGEKVDIVSGK